MSTPITALPTPDEKHRALITGGVLLAAALAVLPLAHEQGPTIRAFLPIYGTAVMLTELVTAYLLFAMNRIEPRPELGLLASAYLFCGTIVMAQMLVFPGVFSDTGLLGAGPQSAVWMWALWHGTYPLFILGYCLCLVRPGIVAVLGGLEQWGRLLPWGTLLIVAAYTALVTLGHDWLPPFIVAGDYKALLRGGWGPLILALNLAALFLFLRTTRLRSLADLWIAVAVLAATLDVMVTLAGAARFTLGWYMARVFSVISAGIVLMMLLRTLIDLFHATARRAALLEREATSDSLTGLANRRMFEDRLAREWRRGERLPVPLALIALDIDHFKGVNDTLGHPAGDAALTRVANILREVARREGDLAARIGGEEFALLLPATTAEQAMELAEAIRAETETAALTNPGTPGGILTVSLGVATSDRAVGAFDLAAAADKALYAAKRAGRNRVALVEASA